MIRRIFVTGLAAIIPIVITVYVISGLFRFADGILGKYINEYIFSTYGYRLPGLGIIISLLIIFLLGGVVLISRMRFIRFIENAFFRLPLVKNVYFPVKKIVDFLFLKESARLQKVVLVEYPRKGIYSIGFVTNESSDRFRNKIGKKLYNVFIGSSPSPVTGFTIIVPEDELIFLDISVEEALKIIVSGGMINPDEETA